VHRAFVDVAQVVFKAQDAAGVQQLQRIAGLRLQQVRAMPV
jgi:hypothetical protein